MVRSVLALLFVVLGVTGVVTGVLAIVLYVIGGIFLLTVIFGWCPIYALLRIHTNKA
jgi:hypothetical protein